MSTLTKGPSIQEVLPVPALTGKRYMCEGCGAEVIVTRGGEATIYCMHDGTKVELKLKT